MFTHMTLTTYTLMDQIMWHLHLAEQGQDAQENARETHGGQVPVYRGEGEQLTASQVLRSVADALDRVK